MKGLAFRKLSRTKSHRNHLLRNLVTSLLQHDRIVTTVAKAKEAQREAEKIITLGKRALAAGAVPRRAGILAGLDESSWIAGFSPDAARAAAASTISQANHLGTGRQARSNAHIYLYSPKETLPYLYSLAQRYAARPGGYTRIHLMGHRKGDHAPRAVLELVDGPRDVRLEMTARAVARQLYVGVAEARVSSLSGTGTSVSSQLVGSEPALDAASVEKVVQRFLTLSPAALSRLQALPEASRDEDIERSVFGNLFSSSFLNPATQQNVVKVTQFGGLPAVERLLSLAIEHVRYLGAEDELERRKTTTLTSKPEASSSSTVLANIAPRGGDASITPKSADLRVPIDSSYTLSSLGADKIKTRRRHAGAWRPHAIGNTRSSIPASVTSGLVSKYSSARVARGATHGGVLLRVRRGGSESPIALGKGVFGRKRLQKGLEVLGGRRKASAWTEVELGETGRLS